MQCLRMTFVRSGPKKPVTFIVIVKRLCSKAVIIFSGGSNLQWQTYEVSLKGKLVGPVILPSTSLRLPPQATMNESVKINNLFIKIKCLIIYFHLNYYKIDNGCITVDNSF